MVMRSGLLLASGWVVASGLAAAALAIGCASILSIPDRTLASTPDGSPGRSPDGGADGSPGALEWCNRPENKHDFCDDFDHDDAGSEWTAGSTDGAAYAFTSSSDTPPTALDMTATPEPLGMATVAGFYLPFTQKFDHIRLAVDVKFVSADLESEAGLSAQLGFLLIEQTAFCIGAVLTPAGIGLVMRSNSTDCTGVTNLPSDAGTITDDAGLTGFAIVGPVPTLNQWSHISLDVKRGSDGSGVVGFDINLPGRLNPPSIPPGYLTEDSPAVAIATSVVGPSGRIELQFDNVTVDFPTN
jgi:hypothetical protein